MQKGVLYPLRRLHGILNEERTERKNAEALCAELRSTEKDTVFFVLTPTHGNLGDHAIMKATATMLDAHNIQYKEVTMAQLVLLKRFRKLDVMNSRPILVNGGGNLGMLWPKVESTFRALILSNPDSPILCLPNTIYYDNSANGLRSLEKSRRIYNQHAKLKLCARESVSYNFMKLRYKDVVLIPDMALSMNECDGAQTRRGCLLCLRQDVEKTRTEAEENEIREQARKLFGENVTDTDMSVGRPIPAKVRNDALEKKFDEFRHAELVITDRLHGMVFCAVTGTPCIVLNSKSPKVRGCYAWVKDLPYIQFADRAADVEDLYHKIPKKDFHYNNQKYAGYYEELMDYIFEMTKRATE
jgi:pyruvyl transferase EpsI